METDHVDQFGEPRGEDVHADRDASPADDYVGPFPATPFAALPRIEHDLMCPYCWETISMLIDPAALEQNYVEDCEVCCNPIDVTVRLENGAVVGFEAVGLGQ